MIVIHLINSPTFGGWRFCIETAISITCAYPIYFILLGHWTELEAWKS